MPTISMFYGIIVYLYHYDNREHNIPHIHAEYQEYKAVYSIEDGELLAGNLPKNKHRMVQVWIDIHQDDLNANWKLAVTGQKVFRIEPLR